MRNKRINYSVNKISGSIFSRIRFLLIPVLFTFVFAPLPWLSYAGDPVADIVNLIDVDSYSYYLNDRLYAHDGDDRMYGPEHDSARDNIFEDLSSFGLDVTFDPFNYLGNTYYNVVAVHTGKVRPEQIYIIGAHFDSVGNPGADDNASGVAGVLEAARVLAQLDFEATIIFIAFDREEQWMRGSYAYAGQHGGDDIRGMISADMIAYNPSGRDAASVYSSDFSGSVKSALISAFDLYVPEVSAFARGISTNSDHYAFESAGFKACLLIEDSHWFNPYYHQPEDSVDTAGYIDYVYAANMTRGMAAWLVMQAGLRDPVLSEPVPGVAGEVNSFRVSGATAGLRTYFIYGLRRGSTEVPVCPGLFVDIAQPVVAGSGVADSLGEVLIERYVPASAAGKLVNIQAVEVDSCRTSNLVGHTFN